MNSNSRNQKKAFNIVAFIFKFTFFISREAYNIFFWRAYISLCINIWLIYYVSWSLPVRINFKFILMTYKLNHYNCFFTSKIYEIFLMERNQWKGRGAGWKLTSAAFTATNARHCLERFAIMIPNFHFNPFTICWHSLWGCKT